MGRSVYIPSTGRIVRHGDVRADAGEAEFPAALSGEQVYIVNDAAVPRPILFDAAAYRVPAGQSLEVEHVPPGTLVMVFDGSPAPISSVVVDDGIYSIAAAATARVELIVEPPWPWRHQVVEVIFE